MAGDVNRDIRREAAVKRAFESPDIVERLCDELGLIVHCTVLYDVAKESSHSWRFRACESCSLCKRSSM